MWKRAPRKRMKRTEFCVGGRRSLWQLCLQERLIYCKFYLFLSCIPCRFNINTFCYVTHISILFDRRFNFFDYRINIACNARHTKCMLNITSDTVLTSDYIHFALVFTYIWEYCIIIFIILYIPSYDPSYWNHLPRTCFLSSLLLEQNQGITFVSYFK